MNDSLCVPNIIENLLIQDYHYLNILNPSLNWVRTQLIFRKNLNPIERLWKVMNEHVKNNHYFATAKELRERIDEFFEVTLPEISETLTCQINDNFQTLKSATLKPDGYRNTTIATLFL